MLKRIDINPKDYERGSNRRQCAQVLQQQIESELNGIIDTINAQQDIIAALTERVQALEGSEPEPPQPGDIPADITRTADLIAYANARYYDEARREVIGEEFKREICKPFRDMLIAEPAYPHIQLHPDWIAANDYERRHFDAYYDAFRNQIIDFAVDSSAGGKLIEKLNRGVVG